MRTVALLLLLVLAGKTFGEGEIPKPKPADTADKADEPKSGRIIGELKSQTDTQDKKNTIIEVLAPGEEKPRKYYVLYDPEIKGPIASVLKEVRAAKVGDRVDFDWVQTGHGPAIKSFRVLKKATSGNDKKDTADKK